MNSEFRVAWWALGLLGGLTAIILPISQWRAAGAPSREWRCPTIGVTITRNSRSPQVLYKH